MKLSTLHRRALSDRYQIDLLSIRRLLRRLYVSVKSVRVIHFWSILLLLGLPKSAGVVGIFGVDRGLAMSSNSLIFERVGDQCLMRQMFVCSQTATDLPGRIPVQASALLASSFLLMTIRIHGPQDELITLEDSDYRRQ